MILLLACAVLLGQKPHQPFPFTHCPAVLGALDKLLQPSDETYSLHGSKSTSQLALFPLVSMYSQLPLSEVFQRSPTSNFQR